MNIFENLLTSDRTVANQNHDTSKRVLQHLSVLLASSSSLLDSDNLFEAFIQREKLGSTYIGHGVAIPHLRSKEVLQPYGALIHLSKGINFDQDDNEMVDLFFGFIVPLEDNDQHLLILAALAEKFNDPIYRKKLRSIKQSEELFTTAIR